jgi:transcription elongation factor GreA
MNGAYMNKVYYCTPEGYSQLITLRDVLKTKRSELVEESSDIIKNTNEDLGESVEYLQNQDEIDRVEHKFTQIINKLSSSKIIDIKTISPNGKVVFGSTVKLCNLDDEKEVTYKIVGTDESDVKLGKISLESPLAKAMLGQSEGDEFDLETPRGDVLYEIINIKYK